MRIRVQSLPLLALLVVPSIAHAQSTPTPAPTPVPHPTSPPRVPDNAFKPDFYQRSTFHRADILRISLADQAEARRIYETPELHAKSYRWAQRVAECIVENDGEKAAALVAPAGYDDLAQAVGSRHRWCFQQRAPAGAAELRNATLETLNSALAESMVRMDGITYADRAPNVNVNEAERFSGLVPGADVDLDMVGRCVAVYSPGLVQQVLDTIPGSAEERGALEHLYNATPECGVEDRPQKIPATLQRVAVAKGLYLWSRRS